MFTYYDFPTIQYGDRVLVVNSETLWSTSVTPNGTIGECRKPSELLSLIENKKVFKITYRHARLLVGDKNLTRAKNAIKNYN